MSYVHCGKCDWGQDDFWSWRYNPLVCLWKDKYLLKPHSLEMDLYIVRDLEEYTGVKVKTYQTKHRTILRVDSVSWFRLEVVKNYKIFRKQHWWTRKKWAKSNRKCPICNSLTIQD